MRMLTEQEHEQLLAAVAERDRLMKLLNTPETLRFLEGTRLEVAHQVERWGTVHDRAKEPADWFWLVGYLAGKALRAHQDGNTEKAQHHCISTAAVLANWHTHIALGAGRMTPGSSDLQKFLRDTFGANFVEKQERGEPAVAVKVTAPDGAELASWQRDAQGRLVDMEDPPACSGCGAMAGVCSDYPKCPGAHQGGDSEGGEPA